MSVRRGNADRDLHDVAQIDACKRGQWDFKCFQMQRGHVLARREHMEEWLTQTRAEATPGGGWCSSLSVMEDDAERWWCPRVYRCLTRGIEEGPDVQGKSRGQSKVARARRKRRLDAGRGTAGHCRIGVHDVALFQDVIVD